MIVVFSYMLVNLCYGLFAPRFLHEWLMSSDDSLSFKLVPEFHRVWEEIRRYEWTHKTSDCRSISNGDDPLALAP